MPCQQPGKIYQRRDRLEANRPMAAASLLAPARGGGHLVGGEQDEDLLEDSGAQSRADRLSLVELTLQVGAEVARGLEVNWSKIIFLSGGGGKVLAVNLLAQGQDLGVLVGGRVLVAAP